MYMINHVLQLYSLPIVHVHTRLFAEYIFFEPDYDLFSKLVLGIVKMHMGDPRL